ncbi:MAG: hypothetical protein C5B60_07930 [Chloroflexi bacterium]|nr:MAG: hypothetical protein C5B60_07930 [Chloroflexota bacterium]
MKADIAAKIAENAEKYELKRQGRPLERPPRTPESPPPPPPEPVEPEEEPVEPDKEKEPEHATVVSMTSVQFQQMIQAVIAESRKPVVDEKKLAQQVRMREHNRMLASDQRKMLITRFYSCNHMQLPGSVMTGCSAIAWANQSDGKRRGTCMHCGTIFSSERSECISDEIWQAYKMLVRLPTHPAGNIETVFQSA